ncbi:uncharacterized protein BDZ99DRAFT_90893 [Mytilinidion resinicola]|uniref:Uncharacterized protein n=1 Tax=Mytilinidion resinicola TaxID=574789 RepID=A0A6A6YE20_9PEZI|nr:uncharacterized protein BDZ99DRAFT_90893 [Mytilinidion resinicola]KAF2807072.1 hypothetical protein BDZ99DRAFT_90893 [Mytilinidion resinicola]
MTHTPVLYLDFHDTLCPPAHMMSEKPSFEQPSSHHSPRNDPSQKAPISMSYTPKIPSPLRNEVLQPLQVEVPSTRKTRSFLPSQSHMEELLDGKPQAAPLAPTPRGYFEGHALGSTMTTVAKQTCHRPHPGSFMAYPIRSILDTRAQDSKPEYLIEWYDHEGLPPWYQGGRQVWVLGEWVSWLNDYNALTEKIKLVPFLSPIVPVMWKAKLQRDEEARQKRLLMLRSKWNASGSPVRLDEIAAAADAQNTDPDLHYCSECATRKHHSEFVRPDLRTGRERWHQGNCNQCTEELRKKKEGELEKEQEGGKEQELEKEQQAIAEMKARMAQPANEKQEIQAKISEPFQNNSRSCLQIRQRGRRLRERLLCRRLT